jgi:hypothetical protein
MKYAKLKLLLVFIILVVLISIAYLAFWKTSPKAYFGYDPLPFSKEAWAEADAEGRGHMLNGLLNKHRLRGLTQGGITSLLGEPDSITEGESDSKRRAFYYKLGYMGFNPEASFAFDYRLTIKVKDGIVEDISVDD